MFPVRLPHKEEPPPFGHLDPVALFQPITDLKIAVVRIISCLRGTTGLEGQQAQSAHRSDFMLTDWIILLKARNDTNSSVV